MEVGLRPLPGAEQKRGFDMYILFPSTLISVNRERLTVTFLTPIGPDRTRWTRQVLVSSDAASSPDFAEKVEAMQGKGDAIFDEDIAANGQQQAGALSSYARVGRLSHLEHTVWHLANYVREQIAE